MSGAAEGIAGLALSAVSVASLFITCIECFDIVVKGKNFSEDYEQLCTLFSLQRTRFGLWGESVGLVPNPSNGKRLRYDKNIDRPDVQPEVERILNNIRLLLQDAGRVDKKYGLNAQAQSNDVSTSKGMQVFKGSFDRFKSRIRKNQKEISTWKVTQWAIHDADKFEGIINRLEKFVDGLESITKSLGLLEEQHARLREEIESISDLDSLSLLRAASSYRGSGNKDVFDTASRRLVVVAESISEHQMIEPSFIHSRGDGSFVTAKSNLPTIEIASLNSNRPVPGAWPRSIRSDNMNTRRLKNLHPNKLPPEGTSKSDLLCNHGLDTISIPCSKCDHDATGNTFADKMGEQSDLLPSTMQTVRDVDYDGFEEDCAKNSQQVPQNQRLLSQIKKNVKLRITQSFAAGDANYGNCLASIKSEDETHCRNRSVKMLAEAQSGSSAAKRMFFELRNIRTGKVPFVSAAPVSDSLDKVLASVEGPPETPYEGGVFWITVRLSEIDPNSPPLMRFHTKVYHPNISPQGHICSDFGEQWSNFLSPTADNVTVIDKSSLWYHRKSSVPKWTLGALLTAICALLASPDIDDPLVPEIAQIYVEDYDGYCKAAKLYTQRYATSTRPDEDSLKFLEDIKHSTHSVENMSPSDDSLLGQSVLDSEAGNSVENVSISNDSLLGQSVTDSEADDLDGSVRGPRYFDESYPDELHPVFGESRKPGNVNVLPSSPLLKSNGTIGFCSLEAPNKPFYQVLLKLKYGHSFEVVVFEESVVRNEVVENWPICDYFICVSSKEFPLHKARAYVATRKPLCVNNLMGLELLSDRRVYLRILEKMEIATPRRLEVNRDGGPQMSHDTLKHLLENPKWIPPVANPYLLYREDFSTQKDWTFDKLMSDLSHSTRTCPQVVELVDQGDSLSVDGSILQMPFVEKTASEFDQEFWIYYPRAQGGGCRRVFWNKSYRSSEWIRDGRVPRAISDLEGTYVYEEDLAASKSYYTWLFDIGADAYFNRTQLVQVDERKNSIIPLPSHYLYGMNNKRNHMFYQFGQKVCSYNFTVNNDKLYLVEINGRNLVRGEETYVVRKPEDIDVEVSMQYLQSKFRRYIEVCAADLSDYLISSRFKDE